MLKRGTISTELLIVAIVAMGVFALSCEGKPKRKKLTNQKELKEVSYSFANPPKFVKEGELSFFDKNEKTTKGRFNIEIADSEKRRIMGLMYRNTMEHDQAMLFVFETEEIQSFWMRNTLLSLDIVFVNSMNEIVTIHKNTPTLSDQSFRSEKPSILVVELLAGTCDSLGIEIGDMIDYNRLTPQ